MDYPHTVASVVFLTGCNLRCGYCHNPELAQGIMPERAIYSDELIDFLDKRKNLIQGVCITGGEPLLFNGLFDFIQIVRNLGLKVKIDTNGTLPDRLKDVDADFIAMDIKTLPQKYSLLNPIKGLEGIEERIIESIRIIVQKGVEHQFRTTLSPGIVELSDIDKIRKLVPKTSQYVINPFSPNNTLDPDFSFITPYSQDYLASAQALAVGQIS